jgi:hypothetical protein
MADNMFGVERLGLPEQVSRRRDTKQVPSASGGLPFQLFGDLGNEMRKTWLVKGLLGVGEMSSFYGEPGSGKSVLVEDLGLHIAAGRPWHGRAYLVGARLSDANLSGATWSDGQKQCAAGSIGKCN